MSLSGSMRRATFATGLAETVKIEHVYMEVDVTLFPIRYQLMAYPI